MRRTLRVGLMLASSTIVSSPTSAAQTPSPPVVIGLESTADPAHPRFVYPVTRRGDVVETRFGQRIADPYRWLENDVRTDADVKSWVDAQNAVTNAFLSTLPARKAIEQRITELYNYERFAAPEKKGGRYFYTHNTGLQNQSVLFVRDKVDGEGRVLIDPNPWSKDGATALAEWDANEQGTKLLYA